MSSISTSHGTRNPNSNPSTITRPSTSIAIKKPTKTKLKKRNSKKSRKPNWLELPEEVWSLILSKLKTIDIIENVQKVCMLFRKICKQPSMFRIIDMYLPDAFMDLPYDANKMTRFAVDRSAGGLLDIYLEYLCDDDTLNYIADRSKNLKHLRLGHYVYVSDEGLIQAIKKLPMLEEVQLIICSFSTEAVEDVGRNCPSLKSFSLTQVGSKRKDFTCNEEALAIAKSMPQLRHLQLIGNFMTNEGLKAILDGCPLLESLDLRACFHIDLSGDLGKRCEGIKHLRRPFDSTKDYGRHACEEETLSALNRDHNSDYEYDGFWGF